MIEPNHGQLSIVRPCELLKIPHASYYRRTDWVDEPEDHLHLMSLINEEYTLNPFYNRRKIRDFLRRNGYKVHRKRVQQLIQKWV